MANETEVGAPKTQGYFEKHEVFSVINNEKTGGKTMLALGNYLLPTVYDTPEQAKAAIDKRDWNVLIDAFGIVYQLIKKIEESKK